MNAIADGTGAVHAADAARTPAVVLAEGEVDFETWVEARGPALLRFAYLVTHDRDTAQDATQEALTSACARWSRISRTQDPEAYVRRMVANAHITWWRRIGDGRSRSPRCGWLRRSTVRDCPNMTPSGSCRDAAA